MSQAAGNATGSEVVSGAGFLRVGNNNNTPDDRIQWLEDRLRSVRKINTKGQSRNEDDDGMLWVATLVLNLHFSVEIKANSLAEIISKGKEYERNKLTDHD
jgi:hypothetical protein